ncbi:MAG: hypothetical protein SNJ64_03950 [Endomicrobiia bacterium]
MLPENVTIDSILTQLFNSNDRYDKSNYWDFQNDTNFIKYLEIKFPYLKDFINICEIEYSEQISIAAITINKNKTLSSKECILYLNPHRITKLIKTKWSSTFLYPSLNYKIFACILTHEMYHIILKHFRLPQIAFDELGHHYMNIADDMIVDNMIHRRISDWRDWSDLIREINNKYKEMKNVTEDLIVKKQGEKNDILNHYDWQLYIYLKEYVPKESLKQFEKIRIDTHKWSETDKNDSNENSSEQTTQNEKNNTESGKNSQDSERNKPEKSQNSSDNEQSIYESIFQKVKENKNKNSKRPLAKLDNNDFEEQIIESIARGKERNLYNILKRYVRKISLKQKKNSWKKISRKQPYLRPGVQYKKQPGEILLVVDTSGSMHNFLKEHLPEVYKNIYSSFKKIQSVFGQPSSFYLVETSNKIHRITKIKEFDFFNQQPKFIRGGNTDYLSVFKLILNWRKETGSLQKLPDLIIFISDFETNFDFMKKNNTVIAPEYKELGNKLLWLYTNEFNELSKEQFPPVGDVVNLMASDWGTSIR